MAGNKKPRKKHVPKPNLQSPMMFGIAPEGKQAMKLIPHTALDTFRTGSADEDKWHTVCARLNLAYVMAKSHEWGMDLESDSRAALDAIVAVMERKNRIGKFGMTGDELKIIGQALNNADEMENCLTRKELYACYKEVMKAAVY